MEKDIKLQDSHGNNFPVYLATPNNDHNEKYPNLILIEEIWGVDEHIRDVVRRFRDQGFNVASPELLADTGILEKMNPQVFADMQNPEKRHEAQAKMREAMQPLSAPEYAPHALDELKKTADYLLSLPSSNGNVAVLGFCFGGTYAFQLAVEDSRIKACIPFYGQPPMPLEKIQNITCPVYAFYGEKDERLMQSLPHLEEAMKKYGKNFKHEVYKNTGHAFFNDRRGEAYNREAATDSWKKALALLRETTA